MTMATEAAEATAPVSNPKPEGKAEPKSYHVDEMKSGRLDPFTVAFNESQDELRGKDSDDKPKPKAKKVAAKPEAKPEPKKEVAKPEPKAKAKEAEDEDDDDGGEEATDSDAEDKKAKPPAKLEPKRWWSSKKRDAFSQMPRNIQEEWLAEAPKPDQRWSEEQKAAFAKIPTEGQELVLERQQDLERGYNEKFMATAAERKFAEDIRQAVPPPMRAFMEQRGLSETQVFTKLLQYQHHAMTDKLGYVRKFIADNKISPLDIIPMDGEHPTGTQSQPKQADVTSHPAFQAMHAELSSLRASVQAETQKREAELARKSEGEFKGLLSKTDGEGNSLYPFIRLLADPMAQIIQSDPDRFGSLSVEDRMTVAYHQALEDFPELSAVRLTAPKAQNDDSDADTADSDEDGERVAKIDRALTPKSRAIQAPAGKSDAVSLDDAIAWAVKKQSKR